MAVLKYKSDGEVKTLGVVKSGVSGVSSVNGKTGVVTGVYDTDNQPPYPVKSVNGKTGFITGLYDAENQPPYPVTSVNGKTGAVTGLYDANNPPPQTVKSAVVTLQKDIGYGGYFFPAGFPQNNVSKFIKAYFEGNPPDGSFNYGIFIFGTTAEGNGVRVTIAGLYLDVSSNRYYISFWEDAPSISVRVYYEE